MKAAKNMSSVKASSIIRMLNLGDNCNCQASIIYKQWRCASNCMPLVYDKPLKKLNIKESDFLII